MLAKDLIKLLSADQNAEVFAGGDLNYGAEKFILLKCKRIEAITGDVIFLTPQDYDKLKIAHINTDKEIEDQTADYKISLIGSRVDEKSSNWSLKAGRLDDFVKSYREILINDRKSILNNIEQYEKAEFCFLIEEVQSC